MTHLLCASLLIAGTALADPAVRSTHEGLHAAAEDPTKPPPSMLLSDYDLTQLNKGGVLHEHDHIKGHELTLTAVMAKVAPHAVWDQILEFESYPNLTGAVLWARLDSERREGERHWLDSSLELNVPGIPSEFHLRGSQVPGSGYLSFQLLTGEGNPFEHMVGYWTVVPYANDSSLVTLLIDGKLDLPIPKKQRERYAADILGQIVTQIARWAESREPTH